MLILITLFLPSKKHLSKGFQRSKYWSEYKTKSKNKNTKNEYRYFRESNFVEVNRLFVLTYSNQCGNLKRYKVLRYDLRKGIMKNYNVTINGKSFYEQPIDSDIKRYEVRKLTTRQGKDCTQDVC